MNRQEYLLIMLAEECAEVQHAVSKALCFGLNNWKPGTDITNGKQIDKKLGELLAVYSILVEENILPESPIAEADVIFYSKRKRIEACIQYSQSLEG